MTLSPKTRRCRNQHSMAFQTPIANTDVYKGSFFPQTIRDWNALPDSLISSAEMQRIVLLSSHLWWELGTNSLITGASEWLSFRRFTSKLSWSWSWSYSTVACPNTLTLHTECRLGTRITGLSPQYFNTGHSKAVLLLRFLTVTCSCCPYLYFGSPIMWGTYLSSWMTTCLGKSCSFGLPRVPFVNCGQFMYLVISLLVLRAGCGIWLYQFLIIAYLFTFLKLKEKVQVKKLTTEKQMKTCIQILHGRIL